MRAVPVRVACGLPERIREPGWPRELSETTTSARTPWVPGSTTIALLPDTQYYTSCEYPHLKQQSDWIWEQRHRRNIVAAVTLGDLTNGNSDREWQFLATSYQALSDGFPLLLTTGNHDLSHEGHTSDRTSAFADFFDESWARRSGKLLEVQTPGHIDNAFYSLDLGHVKLGVLMLEWSPRGETVRWANRVLSQHEDHRVLVATHAYLYSDDTRYDWARRHDKQKWNPLSYATARGASAGDDNHDGELLWNDLIRRHANVFMVVSGHVLNDGTGHLTSRGDAGNTVDQVLVNYQMLNEGGLGYLRMLELLPDGKTLHMKTYSPSLGVFSQASDQDFSITVEPPLFAKQTPRYSQLGPGSR